MLSPALSRLPTLVVAIGLCLFAITGHAQLLTADYSVSIGDRNYFDTGGARDSGKAGVSITQTFGKTTAINYVTWQFTANNVEFEAFDITAYFSEWSGVNATTQLGHDLSLMLPNAKEWTLQRNPLGGSDRLTYDVVFDLRGVAADLDTQITYGLTSVGNANTEHIQAGVVMNTANPYRAGSLYVHNRVSDFRYLTGGGSSPYAYDIAFIASATVPETSTVVVLLAMLLIGGLVAKRLWQRRSARLAA